MRDFTQAYVSKTLDYFKPDLMKKWNFSEYSDPTKPAFFFGLYSEEDMDFFKNHESYKILYFGGNDLREKQISIVSASKNTVCVGYGGDWLKREAELHNLPYDDTIINTRDYNGFEPVPLGDKIYVYRGRLGTRPDYFKWNEIVVPLIKEFGEHRFIYADNLDLITLRETVYRESFVYVKPVSRGGSTAMHELGFMGRMTITQDHHSFPHTISYDSIDDIINIIKREEAKIGTVQHELYDKLKRLTDQNDDWLHVNYYDWNKLNNR